MCPPFRKAAAEGYSEKFGFLMIELSDKINRSGRFNVFQTNLENKLLNGFKLLNSFTFIQILVTFLKVEGIPGMQLDQKSRMESFATIVNGF